MCPRPVRWLYDLSHAADGQDDEDEEATDRERECHRAGHTGQVSVPDRLGYRCAGGESDGVGV